MLRKGRGAKPKKTVKWADLPDKPGESDDNAKKTDEKPARVVIKWEDFIDAEDDAGDGIVAAVPGPSSVVDNVEKEGAKASSVDDEDDDSDLSFDIVGSFEFMTFELDEMLEKMNSDEWKDGVGDDAKDSSIKKGPHHHPLCPNRRPKKVHGIHTGDPQVDAKVDAELQKEEENYEAILRQEMLYEMKNEVVYNQIQETRVQMRRLHLDLFAMRESFREKLEEYSQLHNCPDCSSGRGELCDFCVNGDCPCAAKGAKKKKSKKKKNQSASAAAGTARTCSWSQYIEEKKLSKKYRKEKKLIDNLAKDFPPEEIDI